MVRSRLETKPQQTRNGSHAQRKASRKAAPGRGYSLKDTQTSGFKASINACSFLVGLGTTGTTIVDRIAQFVLEHFGALPKSIDYLTVDGAAARGLCRPMRHRKLGVNGCGTDPNEGRRAFLAEYSELRSIVDRMLLGLHPNDPLLPAANVPRDCVDVFLIGGCGGSSGGFHTPCMTLVNDVLIARRVKTVRTNRIVIGPDLAMSDVNRSVTQGQIETTAHTAFQNLQRDLSDHMNPLPLPQTPPSATPFTIPAGERVWSVSIMDGSNGRHQFATMEELIEMTAFSYFTAICTEVMKYSEDRLKDPEILGDTARAYSISHAVTN